MPDVIESQWLERQRVLLDEMKGRRSFFALWSEVNRNGQRVTSLLIIVCSVLAPVTIVSSPDSGLGLFGLSPTGAKTVSVILTITIALSEAIRRLLRFEHRWLVCANCREGIGRLENHYLDLQVGKQVGSKEWVANLKATRNAFEDFVMFHLQDFATMLAGDDSRKKGSARRTSHKQRID